LIADGDSLQILFLELMQLYQGKSLAPLSIQFSDFAHWIRQKNQFTASADFWKKQFEDYEEQFHLPTDLLEWEMSEQETPLAGVVEVSIANTDKKALNEFVRQHRLQLTSLCALAIGLVLGKHSRCTDFVIGMPAASRSHPQLKQMVGDFVNTLPLRLTLDYGQTALQQLQQLQAHFYSILEHQMYPFEYLLESIAYEQKAGQFPLFNVLLSFPNHQELHKSREQGMARRSLQAMYDLTWTLLDFGEDGLQLNLEYDARKYKEEKIRQMARQTKWVLQQLIQWPERNLSSITLWEESTAASFLATYSVGQKAFSPSPYASVLEAFSVQASRQAENVAIRSGQDQWTYAMMDRKIRQIAHKLIGLGIQKGDRVVVDVADPVQQILAMWGIWCSGAVYVPIDHKAPQFRKDWVAKDCRPSVSIGSDFLDSELWEGEMASAKECLPTTPAYLLYTSGSSGRPKGVLVSHGSLLSKMEEERQLLQLDEQMTAYCITNSVFDVSLLERVLPICCGGSMAIPSENSFASTTDAIQDLLRDKVNILQGTPTYFSHFLSLLDPTSAQSLNEQLQHLCIGGESLNSVLVRKLKNHLPSTRLHNHYGPTETTIDAVAALDIVEFKENIIGRPFGQGRVGVIDEFDHFLPPTVIGELVIAGPGLAMGYWQDDALSNDKFGVHPAMGERIYRTGDLVCWTEEGQLKFIGRKDAQVKYRGYRIEPAEIAACIQDFPAVADAHVRVLGNSLVAWMVGDAIDKSALQDFLESQLPTYMIPGAMECIDFIPRTASGKVAVDQLPEPQQLQQGHVAARTAWEEKITAVWQEVLSVDQIGIYDNFFALGGHSLKAIGLIKLYHKYFGVKVKMRDIFRRTTVESQARLIQSLQKNHYSAIERLPVAADHAVSPAQKRLWILSQVQKASLAYNMPGKVRLGNRYTAEQLQQALYMVIDRFEILRTTFFENEQGELRQKIWQRSELSIPIDIADLTASLNPLAEVTDFIEQLSFEPFDLEKGPLLRACIFILPDEHLQLCFNMHHIISDGYSIDVLSENIGLALEAVKNGGEESLAPLSIQYKEYA
ncbi:MAG: condensation domain-containing protein, partial [Bacteroidota bacterium]